MTSASKYFQALLGPNFKEGHEEEVTISNIDGPTLKAIIDFCYSGNIKITDENILKIVSAASAMEFVSIEKKCETFWNDNLAIANCVDTFLFADKFSFSNQRQKSLDFVCEHFEAVDNSELQKLDFPHFSEILKCDKIHALEDSIFNRLVLWVDYDTANRSKYVPDLIKLIRMEKISKLVGYSLHKTVH